MRKYPEENWKAVGAWVHDARMKREDLRDMETFARLVGRSTRVLQGLERGESVGIKTIEEVARVLEVPSFVLMTGLADPGHEFFAGGRGQTPAIADASPEELLAELQYRVRGLQHEVTDLRARLTQAQLVGREADVTPLRPQGPDLEMLDRMAARPGVVPPNQSLAGQDTAGEENQDDDGWEPA